MDISQLHVCVGVCHPDYTKAQGNWSQLKRELNIEMLANSYAFKTGNMIVNKTVKNFFITPY